jgi:putative transposase
LTIPEFCLNLFPMPRLARVLIPDCPHHITHRGNRRENVFFDSADREHYLSLLSIYSDRFSLNIIAYCLMDNHIHLVAIPLQDDSLAKTIGNTHRRYSRWINTKRSLSGHLWENRYFSTPLDEPHTMVAVKYVEPNPVRAGLAAHAQDWLWSSARSHVFGIPDPLLAEKYPLQDKTAIDNWSSWLADGLDDVMVSLIRRNTCTGRPSGSEEFVRHLENLTNRILTPQKTGRKRKCAMVEK